MKKFPCCLTCAKSLMTPQNQDWLGLMIGNSRLHWAFFQENTIEITWDNAHISTIVDQELPQDILPPDLVDHFPPQLPLYIASVVPRQTAFWQTYRKAKLITLEDIPLRGIYSTLGIDRALAVWGTGSTWGFPCLVIDAGTGLTFTGVDSNKSLVGGAILPGLGLQLQSLSTKTAALPKVRLPEKLPQRWATETSAAITSGVIYTLLAGIQAFITDWLQQFPDSQIALTGGDCALLLTYLKIQYPEIATRLILDSNLIFLGMRSLVIS